VPCREAVGQEDPVTGWPTQRLRNRRLGVGVAVAAAGYICMKRTCRLSALCGSSRSRRPAPGVPAGRLQCRAMVKRMPLRFEEESALRVREGAPRASNGATLPEMTASQTAIPETQADAAELAAIVGPHRARFAGERYRMTEKLLAWIETVGLPTALSGGCCHEGRNVRLIGYEKTRGGGLVIVKDSRGRGRGASGCGGCGHLGLIKWQDLRLSCDPAPAPTRRAASLAWWTGAGSCARSPAPVAKGAQAAPPKARCGRLPRQATEGSPAFSCRQGRKRNRLPEPAP